MSGQIFGVRTAFLNSHNFWYQDCSLQIFGVRTTPLNPLKFLVFRTAPFKLSELLSSIPTIFGVRTAPFKFLVSELLFFRCQNCSFQIFGLRTAPLNPFKIWVFRTAFKLLELLSSIPTILVSGLLPSNFWCQNCVNPQILGVRTAPFKFLVSGLLLSIPSNF